MNKSIKVGILGLGYVGLPVALQFSTKYMTVGYDINKLKIRKLNKHYSKKNIKFTSNLHDLKNCNFFIVLVPTPVKKNNIPDLSLLINACKTLAKVIKDQDIIVFESTVFPGVTEDICQPIIEKNSKFQCINKANSSFLKKGFYLGYSPERINPGDNSKTFEKIAKVISGSTDSVGKKIKQIYQSVLKAKTFLVSSIKVAESAKIIENIQRDVNIAFVNELSKLFKKMNLNTEEILQAAETKWNFTSYRPGLVGGHCIGVDTYYLTYLAHKLKFNPEFILKARSINNSMHKYIVNDFLKLLKTKKIDYKKSRVLIFGFAFKENFEDIRSTRVYNLYKSLIQKGIQCSVYDPYVSEKEVKLFYKINLLKKIKKNYYDAAIIAVKHDHFKKLGINKIKSFLKNKSAIYDVKYLYKSHQVDKRL